MLRACSCSAQPSRHSHLDPRHQCLRQRRVPRYRLWICTLASLPGFCSTLLFNGCAAAQARSAIQQALLPRPDRPQPETELVTVSEGGKCFKVKEIEGGRPAVQRGVQRLVFASSGTDLLGAMHSGATFLWSRLKSLAGTAGETGGALQFSAPHGPVAWR